MDSQINQLSTMELVCCIVPGSEGDKCIKLANKVGVNGGTVFLGEGTAKSNLLKTLGLDKIKRDIVLMIAPSGLAAEVMHFISDKLQLEKKHKGVSFRLPLTHAIGVLSSKEKENYEGVESEMHQAIFVIVNDGEAENVMSAAQDAGAQGGTVIQAHGAGGYETKRVFKMDIEPEKEIVLIISESSQTEAIIFNVKKELHLEEPNTGILFVTDLSETIGIA